MLKSNVTKLQISSRDSISLLLGSFTSFEKKVTSCITDSDKLYFGMEVQSIFAKDPAGPKKVAYFKSGQKLPRNKP